MTVIIDYSHVHRPITGIERISLDVFSSESLRGVQTTHVRAKSTLGMIAVQWLKLPFLALMSGRQLFICPGFPPSIFLSAVAGNRLITYIHDLFLLTRAADLNFRAKYYMRPSFQFAVNHGRNFLVNSLYTKKELERFCSAQADIRLLRPIVKNVFGLDGEIAIRNFNPPEVLKLISIGTLEPRKNYLFAAQVRKLLSKALGKRVEFHIIGRNGWGDEAAQLAREEDVTLHGYCTNEQIKALVQSSDVFLCTSKEEGLGLPLLEIQHGGIMVAATDLPVFREVMGESGCYFPIDAPEHAVTQLLAVFKDPDWKQKQHALACANVLRWNALAQEDMNAFIKRLE